MASYQGMLTLALTVVLLALPSLTYGETLYVRPTSPSTSCPTYPCHTLSEYAQDIGQYFNDTNLTLQFSPGNHSLSLNVTITSIHQLEILGDSSAVVPTRVVCYSSFGFILKDIIKMKIEGLAFISCATGNPTKYVGFYSYTLPNGLCLQSVQMTVITNCTFQNTSLKVVDSRVVLRGSNSFSRHCYKLHYTNICDGRGVLAERSNVSFTGINSFLGTTYSFAEFIALNNSSVGGGAGILAGAGSNVYISGNTTFINNSASDGGGLYAAPTSNVYISGNTTFINNSAIWGDGGGIYAKDNSNVYISGNTTFTGNSASGNGGGIYAGSSFIGNVYIDISGNTTFIGNSAKNGGGIYAKSLQIFNVTFISNVYINGNTTFIGNSAKNGGGIYAESKNNIHISGNTTFISNSAKNGGGIYAESKNNIHISGNTTFINNSAKNGGGIYAESKNNIHISGNTTFISNSANNGGGIHTFDWNNVIINGNTAFINNTARNNGGGVYSECASNTNISGNTTFIGNSARLGGGVCALIHSGQVIEPDFTRLIRRIGRVDKKYYVIGHCGVSNIHRFNSLAELRYSLQEDDIMSNSITNICGNITFINNSAEDGGGMYIKYNMNINANTIFNGNSATTGNGGGVNVKSTSNVGINGNITFIHNSARRNGGGVYTSPSSSFKVNGNITFNDNSAGDGGGFYIGSSSVEVVGNTTFNSNSAMRGGCIFLNQPMTLDGDSSFKNCSANYGGAVYAEGIQVKFSGNKVFSSNTATHFGGGVFIHKSSVDLIMNHRFIANFAGLRGGSIFAQQSKICFSGSSLVSDNVAQLDGGGIYADGSNLSFSGSITIRNNTAQLGGGVYSDNNTFTIDGNTVIERNAASDYGGGIYTQRSLLNVAGNNQFNANSAGEGGGIYATTISIVNLNGLSTFIGNTAHVSGGGIWLENSILALNGSNHFVECVASYEGGAIFTYAAKLSLLDNNTFELNSATTGGGIHARWSDVSVINSSKFKCNTAVFGGGIFTDNSTFEFNGSSTFDSNQANYTGGGIYAARSVLTFLAVSSVTANRAARDGGGMYTRDDCVVNLLGWSIYQGNSAGDTGGGISAYQSNIRFAGQNTFNRNHAVEGGGFYAFKSTVSTQGENSFITNSATYHGGGLTVMHSTLHLNGSTTFKNNSAASGGGMYIGDSTVPSDGSNCFVDNMAYADGGGIYATDSTIKFNGNDRLLANSAKNRGAAIHSSSTTLIFQGSSFFLNNSAEYGGGIYSESTNLTFVHHGSNHYSPPCSINYKSVCSESLEPKNIFLNNTAHRGGAQYFDVYSNFSLYQKAQVHFQDNRATEFGGAIYAVDVLGPGQFFFQQHSPFRSECFFHMLKKEQSPDLNTSTLIFVDNTAGIRGSVLYGGLLEKCNFTSDKYTSIKELFSMSILNDGRKDDVNHSISSDPTHLCFCNTSELNCREVIQSRRIYPGQQVAVSVVAIDQSGLAIPTLIHTIIHSGHKLTVSEIISYETGENCTYRNYSVTTKNIFNQLELYPNNRSGNTIHLIVNITFKGCPIGFEQSNFTGECICDHRLWQYTNSCDIERQTILRNASRTFWIGVSSNNGTFEGYIHHSYCPLGYCTSKSKHINMHNPDNQCNYNRSGLLCGKCKEGLSLVLGSSQCKECSNNYLALLVPFALAGVLLVILLFLLHLTVAAGTLHGLIFYANIVQANHHIFFPQSSNNLVSIFIAWLNLDLGIQTCFYNGMDAYSKTWLEFVFPVYIWVIVGLLVYISHRSVTVTKILGSSPVPVLATLFLLAYAKVLRAIIAALSLTILHYPHKNVLVWIHDANVSLAKYIPLVLVALLFLLFLFLPYTLLLLLGQWLQPKSHLHLLGWVRNPKLKAILDTYHAPYKPEHRYWTGLLLLLRCALFLAFAFNISGDASVNLLVISSTAFGIIGWFTVSGVVYKSRYLNAIEVSFILNLGMLAVATYHVTLSGGSQAAVAYTSVGIAFLIFVGIVTYHIYKQIKSKVQYIQRGHQLQRENNCHINNNTGISENLSHQPKATPTITRTEVNLHELRSPLDLLSYHQMN